MTRTSDSSENMKLFWLQNMISYTTLEICSWLLWSPQISDEVSPAVLSSLNKNIELIHLLQQLQLHVSLIASGDFMRPSTLTFPHVLCQSSKGFQWIRPFAQWGSSFCQVIPAILRRTSILFDQSTKETSLIWDLKLSDSHTLVSEQLVTFLNNYIILPQHKSFLPIGLLSTSVVVCLAHLQLLIEHVHCSRLRQESSGAVLFQASQGHPVKWRLWRALRCRHSTVKIQSLIVLLHFLLNNCPYDSTISFSHLEVVRKSFRVTRRMLPCRSFRGS